MFVSNIIKYIAGWKTREFHSLLAEWKKDLIPKPLTLGMTQDKFPYVAGLIFEEYC